MRHTSKCGATAPSGNQLPVQRHPSNRGFCQQIFHGDLPEQNEFTQPDGCAAATHCDGWALLQANIASHSGAGGTRIQRLE